MGSKLKCQIKRRHFKEILLLYLIVLKNKHTVCQESSDPFYIESYYTKWVTTSWTHSICPYNIRILFLVSICGSVLLLPDCLDAVGHCSTGFSLGKPQNKKIKNLVAKAFPNPLSSLVAKGTFLRLKIA